MTSPPNQIDHPSPGRDKVAVPWLIAGLAIPSAAWTLEMLTGFGVSSNACPLTPIPRKGGFSGEETLLLSVQLVCLIAAIASGFMSYRHWRLVQAEKQDSEHSHLTIGEGRTRFLAIAGMLVAGTFAVAILFNVAEPILIPSCWSLR